MGTGKLVGILSVIATAGAVAAVAYDPTMARKQLESIGILPALGSKVVAIEKSVGSDHDETSTLEVPKSTLTMARQPDHQPVPATTVAKEEPTVAADAPSTTIADNAHNTEAAPLAIIQPSMNSPDPTAAEPATVNALDAAKECKIKATTEPVTVPEKSAQVVEAITQVETLTKVCRGETVPFSVPKIEARRWWTYLNLRVYLSSSRRSTR